MAGVISRSAATVASRSIFRRIPPAPSSQTRSLSAAAAVIDYYDSEWEEEEERLTSRRWPAPAEGTWREAEGRGVQWVFMGGPGAQKHVHATRLAELLEVPYISMGTLVKKELDPRSSLYMKIANAVNEGKLVPEDIIFGLLSKRLEEGYVRGETGFILDGIPRTQVQAEILDQIADIDLVVNFKSVDCLAKKHFGSHICTHCGKSFDAINSESTSQNPCLTTRMCHSQLKTSAAVDTEEAFMEKFRIYTEQSKHLEEYYRKQQKLLNFHVVGGPGETWHGLLAALHLQHIDAANSSRKLTNVIPVSAFTSRMQ